MQTIAAIRKLHVKIHKDTAADVTRLLADWRQGNAQAFEQLAPAVWDELRRLANAFLIEHDALASIPGGTGLREKLMTDALRYLDALAAEARGVPGIEQELALAYEKMGDVQGRADGPHLGDTAGAIQSYRKALALRERLPASRGAQLDLALTHMRLAGALRIAGDFHAGIQHDLNALQIRESLSAIEPGSLALRRLAAASNTSLGGSFYHTGDLENVRKHRLRAYELASFLIAQKEPTGQDYRIFMLAAVRMGSMRVRDGDAAAGLKFYEEALTAGDEGLKRFPRHSPIRQTRATALGARASIWLEKGRFAEALADCRAARAIYQALHDADPKDVRTSFMLANAIHRTGITLTKAGRPSAAVQEINNALSMREALSAQDPVNAGARAEVAVSLGALGDAQAALGQQARAAECYRRAIALIEDLQLRQQANTEALGELQRVRQRLVALGL